MSLGQGIIQRSLLLGILLPLSAGALAADKVSGFDVHTSYEEWTLPANEMMGMTSFGLRKWVGPYSFVGGDAYAAVAGDRGGFITLGGTAGVRYPLFSRLGLDAGLHVGAGGGAGGRQLAGGGLLLRGNLGLSLHLGEAGTLSVGWSQVDFPNRGTIEGDQLYVSYDYSFEGMLQSGWEPDPKAARRLAWDEYVEAGRNELGLLLRFMSPDAGVLRRGGAVQEDFGMVGAQWRSELNSYIYWSFEGVGAMSGGSSGYMHLLTGLGARVPLFSGLTLSAGVALGGGGGGDVDTGGGLLVDAQLGLILDLPSDFQLELSQTRLVAVDTDFVAQGPKLVLSRRFGGEDIGDEYTDKLDLTAHLLRVRAVTQQYQGATDDWRSLPDKDVQNLGGQLDYFINPNLYLSGQGIAAYAGEAGAYMTGQVGVGGLVPFGSSWAWQTELMVGAAGGGGLATGAGLVAQLNTGLSWRFSRGLGMSLSVGRLYAVDGPLQADVLGLSLDYYFESFSILVP